MGGDSKSQGSKVGGVGPKKNDDPARVVKKKFKVRTVVLEKNGGQEMGEGRVEKSRISIGHRGALTRKDEEPEMRPYLAKRNQYQKVRQSGRMNEE